MNYLPGAEVGGRRRVGPAREGEGDCWDGLMAAAGSREKMDKGLVPGYIVRIPARLLRIAYLSYSTPSNSH